MKNRLHDKGSNFFLLVLLFSLLSAQSKAQHFIFGNGKVRWEAGVNFGPTFFLGDLGGNRGKGTAFLKDVNMELTKLMKGAFITCYPNDWVGLRFAAQYTYIEGQDYIVNTFGVDELWRKQRNLDFKSNMWEAYVGAEVYPLMLLKMNDADYQPRLRPYGLIGVGLFHFNPKGSLTDANGNKSWHALHPLRTEGQGMAEYPSKKPYSLTQVNIPMGGGLKYYLSDRINLAVELLYRKTFTDYLDDVSTTYIDPNKFDTYLSPANASVARQIHDKTVGILLPGITRYAPGAQRGNPRNMDTYFSVVMKFGVRLGSIFETGDLRQTRCPALF
jgi:hypothetical protein